MAIILGIETSCDETAAAVVEDGRIVSNVVASQVKLHAKTGGVVPEVAARAHVERILPVIAQSLRLPKLRKLSKGVPQGRDERLSGLSMVDAIAVTVGPGLLGSLIVGTETAKTLGYVFKKPVLPINHLEGHLVSALVDQTRKSLTRKLTNLFPAIALVVSGGHTELVLVKKYFQYQVIGQTRDDAAGEAFDKIAKLLGLPYPGGPAIAAEAAKLKAQSSKLKIKFPSPMLGSGDFNFSFSGLKTAVLYFLKRSPEAKKSEVAFAVQEAIVDVLVQKTLAAARRFGVKTILLGGGVSANQRLRTQFAQSLRSHKSLKLLIAPSALTTDNAAMIALAGYLRYIAGQRNYWYDVRVDPNLKLSGGYSGFARAQKFCRADRKNRSYTRF